MKAIVVREPGGPEVLQLAHLPEPKPGPGEVRIEVCAAGVNRADLLQRQGRYPPAPNQSPLLGLECAGIVDALGPEVHSPQPGTRVMALLGGGGYAEKVVVDARLTIPMMAGMSFVEAAAIPEAFLTAREGLFSLGQLQPSQHVLIHASGSGVGIAAVQLARCAGAKIFATTRGSKLEAVRALGAHHVIDYQKQDFVEIVRNLTEADGVELILDFVGASYWARNSACLAPGGRCIVIGLLGGSHAEVDFAKLLSGRQQLLGLVMRSRSIVDKAAMIRRFSRDSLPLFDSRRLRAVVDSVFPLVDARLAHEHMHSNANVGKIVLRVKDRD